MGIKIFGILYIVLAGSGANIALAVPISFNLPIVARYRHIMPNVKFAPMIEQRLLYIFLKDECSI